MDETDFKLGFGKSKSKHDKADATYATTKPTEPVTIDEVIEKKLIISRPTEDDTYDCNNRYVGKAVIFNHREVKGQRTRTGTEKDRETMVQTLKRYGFELSVYDDLTFEKINEQINALAKEDHSQSDCFVLVVMSHGTEGKVYAKDMAYPVERLWNPFLGDKCKTLINKPKLFFLQACRGENIEKAVVYTDFMPMSRALESNLMVVPEKPKTMTYAIPSTADMLVMYSTFEKYYSFRNVERGSWFIQSLCSVLDEAAANEAATTQGAELLRLLTAVNRKVAYEYQSMSDKDALNEKKEMPNFLSTLTKTFYLKVKNTKSNESR